MKQKGFTLIELLVTMGIIAVLSGMAVFNFNQARLRARDVQRKSDLSQLQKALELYKNDHDSKYPAALVQQDLIDASYSKVEFVDPKGLGAWYDYNYSASADQFTYTINACLENKTDATRVLQTVGCAANNAGVLYQITNP